MNHSKIILFLLFLVLSNAVFSQNREKKNSERDTIPFSKTEILPQFPGGESKLMEYVSTNIKYPRKAKRKGDVGTSYISFLIKESGEVANIKMHKGIPGCHSCDKEAIRVVKLMPNWIPAKQAGKAVAVQYVLPVRFSLR